MFENKILINKQHIFLELLKRNVLTNYITCNKARVRIKSIIFLFLHDFFFTNKRQ